MLYFSAPGIFKNTKINRMEKIIQYGLISGIVVIAIFILVRWSGWQIENMTLGPRNWRCQLRGARCPRPRSREQAWERRLPQSIWPSTYLY